MTARLRIDRTRCAGHGICVLFAGAVLDLDAWGFPEVRAEPIDARTMAQVRRAVRACPRQALSIEDPLPPVRSLRDP